MIQLKPHLAIQNLLLRQSLIFLENILTNSWKRDQGQLASKKFLVERVIFANFVKHLASKSVFLKKYSSVTVFLKKSRARHHQNIKTN